jgi:diaminopropionate ammonia-lyase
MRKQPFSESEHRFVLNSPTPHDCSDIFTAEDLADVQSFFRSFPGYESTPLRSLANYARELGIADLMVKDESRRLGLNAFKILGVTYAVHRLRKSGEVREGTVLACPTDDNRGRAVAHVARQIGLPARIYIHDGSSPARVKAIKDEGAEVTMVHGNYDDSVHQAAEDAARNGWTVVSDTAWDGYETVPRYVMAGYTMLLQEAAESWAKPPDIVLIQAGVGGLAAAVASWLLHHFGEAAPAMVCCEPANAACVLESLRAGRPIVLGGSLKTIMAGLSSGTVSAIVWPVLRARLRAALAIDDETCRRTVYKLSHPTSGDPLIVAGESGACGIASLDAIMRHQDFQPLREQLGLGPASRVLAINTEGATDPDNFRAITGLRPEALIAEAR